MCKIAAGIVSFNPNLERLIENIKTIKPQVECLLVVDNGSNNISEIEKVCKINDCILIKLNENKGIAYALNQICEYFYSSNYKWVITLDQDSISPDEMVNNLYKYSTSTVGAIGPKIVYRNNEEFTRSVSSKNVENVEWIITSATLTNLSAWKKIGGFDNTLFIDGVDKDFCFRLLKKGYKVLQCNDVELLHELGNLRCRKVFGKTIYVTNHSPERKYYMVRNAIYLDRKNSTNNSGIYILKILLKTVFFESNKISKVKMIFKGIVEAKKMNIRSDKI